LPGLLKAYFRLLNLFSNIQAKPLCGSTIKRKEYEQGERMNDFVTLSCPNCGGKLEVSPNTLSLVCQHCGIEHLVRREAGSILLEAFARCPVCKRNDRAERISAIIDNNTSNIAEKLSPPRKPIPPSEPGGFGVWWVVIGFIGAWLGVVPLIYLEMGILGSIFGFDSGIAMGFGIPLMMLSSVFGVWFVFRYLIRWNKQLIANRKRNPDYMQKMTKHEEAKAEWDSAIRHWKELYYCQRDGIIYNPKTGETCDPDSLKGFLYKHP